jgi:uncharacterized protein (TIGR03437 family)
MVVFAAFGAAFYGNFASAQTPANISVVSGNGQLVCGICSTGVEKFFEPMIVKVTDTGGNPVPSATVNWVISGSGGAAALSNSQTLTGSDGTASNTIIATFGSARLTYTIIASLPNTASGITFSLTAGAPESTTQYATAVITSNLYQTITGTAGGTGAPPVTVQLIDFAGQPLPNISVRLIPSPNYTPGPTAACATGAGADPGSVLTDVTGVATCTPTFGPVPGAGTYSILVGGVLNATVNANSGPLGYAQFSSDFIQVSPGTPSSMKTISGTGQTANPGQALANPLVAEIDTSAGNPLAGVSVNWSVSPAGSASLAAVNSTSDNNGQVSNTVTLTNAAAGTVTVTASFSSTVSVSFSISTNTKVTGLSKLSGDGQTAPVTVAFPNPLTVQVNVTSGQSAANIPVQFSISGPGTLSSTSATTNSSGQASVSVTAGATAGAITVTATSGGSSVSFSLTAAPPGPVITSSSFVNGAGFYTTNAIQSALSPCGVGTVIGSGIAPSVQGVVPAPMFGPLPYQLAGVGITFNNSQAPLYNVANVNGQQQASFQVPCDVTPGTSVPVTVTVNGSSATANVVVRSAGPGIFTFNDTDGYQRAVLVRPDGSFVTSKNPAHAGETLHVYATGLGQASPAVATNSVPVAGTDSLAQGNIVVALNNSGVRVVSSRRAPGLIGVDDIAFQLPAAPPSGNGVLYIAVYPVDQPFSIEASNTCWILIQ